MKQSALYRIFIVIITLVIPTYVFAQDTHLTQFYYAPTYVNPAFAGATPHWRATALYRNQWSGIPDYQFGLASFDYNWDDANSGVGMFSTYEKNGSSGFSNMTLNGQYSFYFRVSNKLMMRLGAQASYVSRSIDFGALKFEDQLLTGGATAEKLPTGTTNAFDVSGGALIYSNKIWFGVSAHHLTRPSMSLLGSQDVLNMRLSSHIGGKFVFGDPHYENLVLMPAIIYMNQASYHQMMAGTNLIFKPMIVGAWYRGFPLLSTPLGKAMQHDAVALFTGFTASGWTLGYSYDFTISGLRGGGGSHEITLSYAPLQDYRRKKGTKHIQCPF